MLVVFVTGQMKPFLWAFDSKRQNSEPTLVTPTSATCLDHMITSSHAETETIQVTIGDHLTVLCEIPNVEEKSVFRE